MSVYVDDMALKADVQNGNRTIKGVWTHLVADSEAELHQFALQLGLKRAYCQYRRSGLTGKPNCHYDLTQSKVKQALQLGATRITTKEALQVIEHMDMDNIKRIQAHEPKT